MKHLSLPYQVVNEYSSLPFIWLRMKWQQRIIEAWGLVDSGASINVLPHRVGLQLGLNWDELPVGPVIGGAVAGQTRTVSVLASIADFGDIPMAFCWLNHDNTRLVLGHQDFLEKFVVCFDTKNQNFSLMQSEESK
jgi:hypothetical protein